MQLTFVTDLGQSYAVDIDPDMELENVMALLEAEVRQTFHPAHNSHMSILFLSLPALTMTFSTCVALDHAVKYTP